MACETRSRLALAGLALALALAACVGVEPFAYQELHEIPAGPGLFTGEDGEWVIYGD